MSINGSVSCKAFPGNEFAMPGIIEAQELYRFYHVGDDEIRALRGVSLSIEAGEMVAITGPSGSGKSTLLACLTGLDEPDGGWVQLQGQRLTRRSEVERAAMRARNIGILLQTGNLFDHLSVEDNLRLAQQLAGKPDKPRYEALIERFGLSQRRHNRPVHLSGGEAARVGLAVALSTNPPLLVTDEPTGEVDAENEAIILDSLLAYREQGGTLILATHSDLLANKADRVLRLLDGKTLDD
jgi:putative ABC transport system ATP-binding protein